MPVRSSLDKLYFVGYVDSRPVLIVEWQFLIASRIIVNVTIQVIKMDVLDFITNGRPFDWDLQNWWDWNVHSVWFIWGIVLAIHAYSVFKDDWSFGKDWEDRKIKEIMDKEETEENNSERWI